jgi:integrase/recombinase XerD
MKNTKKTSLPFSKAIDGFLLSAAARGLSDRTVLDYQNTIRLFKEFLGDDNDPLIDSLTVEHIRDFLAKQADRVSNKTLLNYHVGLSAIWTWAIANHLATEHIVRAHPAPKPEQKEVIPFTQSEIKLLFGAVERSKSYARAGKKLCDNAIATGNRTLVILYILLDCGLRSSELCELTMKNVDVRNKRLIVMGKGSKQRIIPFSDRTGKAIWRYTQDMDNPQPTDTLIQTGTGGALQRDQLLHILYRLGDRANVPDVHPHKFRHTFAIQLLRNGAGPYELQALLGHSSLDMVKRYLHLAQLDLDAAHKKASPVDNWRL